MVGKVSSGGGFAAGHAYYTEDKKTKEASELRRMIHLNGIIEESAKEMENQVMDSIAEYNKYYAKKAINKNQILRLMFSLQVGETLSESKWIELVYDYGKELGVDFGEHQMAIYLHTDTANEHVHVQINRLDLGSTGIMKDSNIGRKTEGICKKLSLKYGLKSNPEITEAVKDDIRRDGREEANAYVRGVLNTLLKEGQIVLVASKGIWKIANRSNFQYILSKSGIKCKFKSDATGKLVGSSFQYKNENFTGQQVGWKTERLIKSLNELSKIHLKNKLQIATIFDSAFNNNKQNKTAYAADLKAAKISFSYSNRSNLRTDFSHNFSALIALNKMMNLDNLDDKLEKEKYFQAIDTLYQAQNELKIHLGESTITLTELIEMFFNGKLENALSSSFLERIIEAVDLMSLEKGTESQGLQVKQNVEPVSFVSTSVEKKVEQYSNNVGSGISEGADSGPGKQKIYTEDEKERDEALARKKLIPQRRMFRR